MLRRLTSIVLMLLCAAVSRAQPAREVLISSSKNLNLGTVLFDGKDLTPECPTPWSVQLKLQRGGKQEGVQLLTLDNSKMQIVLIPTRGMGILHVTLGDLKLGWNSPVTEVVHPKHINLSLRGGLGWLEGFNEWLARCGLENTGQAGMDEIVNNVGDKTTVELTLHGKIANIPASEVEIIAQTTSPYRITIRSVMHEKMLFGPKFELVTEVSTEPGSDKFRIQDTIINKGSQPQEYQILYHYNFGKPLLGEGARLHVPVQKVTPYNANAAAAIKTWNSFAAPKSGYVEQVYLMRPLEDDEGNVKVLLHNPKGNRGVLLKYAKKDLPYLTLWKNTGADADGYCIGIEPGVSFPNMRKVEREAGRVPKLAGGASHIMRMDFSLLDTKYWVDHAALQIAEIQKRQAPTINAEPGGAMTERGPWKIVQTREIYRDPWIAVQVDDVIRPDGKPGIHSIIRVKPGVCVLAIDAERNVYLTEEFHYGVGRVTIEGVSGGCEADEEPLTTAQRELREELGIVAGKWTDLGVVDPFTANVVSPTSLYLAEELTSVEKANEGTELIRCLRVSFDEAMRMLGDGKITHAPTCVALLKTCLSSFSSPLI